MIGDNLQQYTYAYLMERALSYVPDDQDKRQGSVIYDALAPFCQLLAAGAVELRNFYTRTYAETATGKDLDNRVAEQGIRRYAATYAVKRITLADSAGNPVSVPLGARFSSVSDTNPINYTVTSQYEEGGVAVAGSYQATCEEAGTIGNEYSGNLINITFIQGLASATMTTTISAARNEETDEELRERYFESLNQKAFGGNIADYRAKVRDEGVGGVQVYPVWQGGGTVKLCIVDAEYRAYKPDSNFVSTLQNKLDPENADGVKGTGLGIAPIGHKVTVVTPTEVPINITATVTMQSNNYTAEQVKNSVKTALEAYIKSLRQSWDDADDYNTYTCNVFWARVSSEIVMTPGIANVVDVKMRRGSEGAYSTVDIKLTENSSVQELPVLGEVTLNVQTTA